MLISGCQKLSRTNRSFGEQQSDAAKDAGQVRKGSLSYSYTNSFSLLTYHIQKREILTANRIADFPRIHALICFQLIKYVLVVFGTSTR